MASYIALSSWTEQGIKYPGGPRRRVVAVGYALQPRQYLVGQLRFHGTPTSRGS